LPLQKLFPLVAEQIHANTLAFLVKRWQA